MSVVPSQPSRPLQYGVAIRESNLPSGVKATCWAIATFANNKTGLAYLTVKTIARAVGLTEATVSKHTGLAEARGYLRKERKFNSSIDYYITVPAPVLEEPPAPPITSTAEEAPAWPLHFEIWSADPDSY
ncbi:Helix-turn-helix domain-containing protein [Arthrobacter sp. P2b]|nr:Helix-turn-helix domain-containing protein [Arthrobacter sp. P2b]